MSTIIGSCFIRFFGALILSVGLAFTAFAHAEFRGSQPAQNAVLEHMPQSITLRFSEQVGVLVLEWRMPDGSVLAAQGEAGAETLTVQPPVTAGRGTYVLGWRVASADGHPVGGSLIFSIGEVTAFDPAADKSVGSLLVVLTRGFFVAALVLSVGAAVFHHSTATLTAMGASIATLSAGIVPFLGLVWIAAEGVERLGLSPKDALGVQSLLAGLQSPVASTVGLAILASLLVYPAVQRGNRAAALVALALAAVSFAVSGHALSAPGAVAPALTALHAAAVVVWVGGLVPLMLAMREDNRLGVMRRFSGVALPAVVILIGSGVGIGLLHLGADRLLASDWAKLLAAKLVAVAGMLALALWHRFWAIPRLASGAEVAVGRSIALEASLGLVVIALAMGFRLAPPPSLANAIAADPVSIHIHSERAMADLVATAPFPGEAGFRLTLSTGDFAPVDPKEVMLTLTDRTAGIGPLSLSAQRRGEGEWEVPPQMLPTPGPWEVRITLLITDFEQITLTGSLPAAGTE